MIDYDVVKGDIVNPILDFDDWKYRLEYDERTPIEHYAEQLINNQVRTNLNTVLHILESLQDEYPMEGYVREELINMAKNGLAGGDE